VYRVDLTRYYLLREEDWKTDMIPEVLDGKNIADYVDADIQERLAALEAEEDALLAADAEAAAARGDDTSDEDEATTELLGAIRDARALARDRQHREKGKNRANLPRTAGTASAAEARAHLGGLGLPSAAVESMLASAAGGRVTGAKRGRPATRDDMEVDDDGDDDDGSSGGEGMELDDDAGGAAAQRAAKRVRRERSKSRAASAAASSRARSHSRGVSREVTGFAVAGGAGGPAAAGPGKKRADKIARKVRDNTFKGTAGESDRRIGAKLPKHLFAGKRGIGKTDRR
jgi:nucleolar GTP-binding protein